MINTVVLVGRLTRDPEMRTTGGGTNMCRFTVACDRPFKSQNGEKQADFISCVAWRKTAELVVQYFHKGSLIGVTGRIQTGSYENQQGQRVYTTDVVADNISFLESRQASQSYANSQNSYQSGGYSQSYNQDQNYGYGGNPQPAYNSYQSPSNNGGAFPGAAPQNSGFSSQRTASNSQFAASQDNGFDSNLFDDSDSLDIASDDLPF